MYFALTDEYQARIVGFDNIVSVSHLASAAVVQTPLGYNHIPIQQLEVIVSC